MRALHDRLQESHTNHTMMRDYVRDASWLLAETNRALKPTQQLHHLKLGSNHHNELPEIFQHLATISGAAGCLFDLHSMMMGLVTLKSLKKKNRLGSTQKNQLHAKARAAVQRNLTPEERNLACEDSKSTPVNTIQWCLAATKVSQAKTSDISQNKVSQAKTKVSQKRLRT